MKTSKGFTIIELLVVIAIIAVLAAIVLVNVTQYIAKGKDAGIQGNLASLMTQAAVYYDDSTLGNGDYDGYCGTATVTSVLAAANKASGVTSGAICVESTDNDKFCACSPIIAKSGTNTQYYCVDSTGDKNLSTTACATSCTAASPACQ